MMPTLDYYHQCLAISKEIGNRSNEAVTLKNLAVLHLNLDHRDLALEFCEQALALATELGIPLAKECQELKQKLLKEEV